MDKILVIGAGDHGKVVADIANCAGHEVVGFLDDSLPVGATVQGISILGTVDEITEISTRFQVTAGVVAIGDNSIRARIVEKVEKAIPQFFWSSLIHPSATVAADVIVGAGSVVMAGVVVNPGCEIGCHCILNTHATLDHDGELECYTSLAPGSVLGGRVSVGGFTAICIGAHVIHGVQIGAQTVIGAGALVIKDIPDHVVAYGSPASIIRSRQDGDRYL